MLSHKRIALAIASGCGPACARGKTKEIYMKKTYGPVRINTADRPDMLFDLNHDSLGSQGWLMTLREG